MNNRNLLELTLMLVNASIRLGSNGTADRTKMEALVETFAARFFQFSNTKQII